jgi:hypothetical protein
VLFPELDGSYFVDPTDFKFDAGTWAYTRDTVGVYGLSHVAAAETVHGVLNLNRVLYNKIGKDPWVSPVGAEYWSGYADASSLPGGGGSALLPHYFRGVQISGFDLIYSIGTLALTSGGVVASRATFKNNTATVVATAPGGAITGTHATATQTNPYVTAFTFATPYILGNNLADVEDTLEFTWVFQATSVFELYGANIYFNYVLL